MVFGIDELLLEPREKALAQATRRFWLNFAAHGNPNGAAAAATAGGVAAARSAAVPGAGPSSRQATGGAGAMWPQFELAHNSTLQLKTPLAEVRGLKQARCDFWDRLQSSLLPP